MSDPSISDIRFRLQSRKGQFPEICRRGDLGYSWLSKFANGTRGKRPSFSSIERLRAVLDELDGADALAGSQPPEPLRNPSIEGGRG